MNGLMALEFRLLEAVGSTCVVERTTASSYNPPNQFSPSVSATALLRGHHMGNDKRDGKPPRMLHLVTRF